MAQNPGAPGMEGEGRDASASQRIVIRPTNPRQRVVVTLESADSEISAQDHAQQVQNESPQENTPTRGLAERASRQRYVYIPSTSSFSRESPSPPSVIIPAGSRHSYQSQAPITIQQYPTSSRHGYHSQPPIIIQQPSPTYGYQSQPIIIQPAPTHSGQSQPPIIIQPHSHSGHGYHQPSPSISPQPFTHQSGHGEYPYYDGHSRSSIRSASDDATSTFIAVDPFRPSAHTKPSLPPLPIAQPGGYPPYYPPGAATHHSVVYPYSRRRTIFVALIKDFVTMVLVFFFDTLPRQLYLDFLLRLPAFYFSRVARIFEEAGMALPEIRDMALQGMDPFTMPHTQWSSPASANLRSTWEGFIESLLREWKTLNIVSVLLLSAIVTILQIEAAGADPITRSCALFSLLCSLMSLLYGCMYIIRFAGMRKTYKALEWAQEAQKTKTLIWWNVWVLLAMPATWLAWSIILYIACIMSFIWRTSTAAAEPVLLSTSAELAIRVALSAVLGLGALYFLLILNTLRQYGDTMDEKFRQQLSLYVKEKRSKPHHAPPYTATESSARSGQYQDSGSYPPSLHTSWTQEMHYPHPSYNPPPSRFEPPSVITTSPPSAPSPQQPYSSLFAPDIPSQQPQFSPSNSAAPPQQTAPSNPVVTHPPQPVTPGVAPSPVMVAPPLSFPPHDVLPTGATPFISPPMGSQPISTVPSSKATKILDLRFHDRKVYDMPYLLAIRGFYQDDWERFLVDALIAWNGYTSIHQIRLLSMSSELFRPQDSVAEVLARWNKRYFSSYQTMAVLCHEYIDIFPYSPAFAIYLVDTTTEPGQILVLAERFGPVPDGLTRIDIFDQPGEGRSRRRILGRTSIYSSMNPVDSRVHFPGHTYDQPQRRRSYSRPRSRSRRSSYDRRSYSPDSRFEGSYRSRSRSSSRRRSTSRSRSPQERVRRGYPGTPHYPKNAYYPSDLSPITSESYHSAAYHRSSRVTESDRVSRRRPSRYSEADSRRRGSGSTSGSRRPVRVNTGATLSSASFNPSLLVFPPEATSHHRNPPTDRQGPILHPELTESPKPSQAAFYGSSTGFDGGNVAVVDRSRVPTVSEPGPSTTAGPDRRGSHRGVSFVAVQKAQTTDGSIPSGDRRRDRPFSSGSHSRSRSQSPTQRVAAPDPRAGSSAAAAAGDSMSDKPNLAGSSDVNRRDQGVQVQEWRQDSERESRSQGHSPAHATGSSSQPPTVWGSSEPIGVVDWSMSVPRPGEGWGGGTEYTTHTADF